MEGPIDHTVLRNMVLENMEKDKSIRSTSVDGIPSLSREKKKSVPNLPALK